MTKSQSLIFALLIPMAVLGCHKDTERAVALKDGASLVCDPSTTLTLRSLPSGRYALRAAEVDSAHVGRMLHNVLPPTPGPRVLLVDVSPDRARDIQWLVPLIEAEGSTAYKPDAACEQGYVGAFFMSASR